MFSVFNISNSARNTIIELVFITYREMPCFSNPNAATVLMAVNTSSAIDPAIEYFSCSKQHAFDAFCGE